MFRTIPRNFDSSGANGQQKLIYIKKKQQLNKYHEHNIIDVNIFILTQSLSMMLFCSHCNCDVAACASPRRAFSTTQHAQFKITTIKSKNETNTIANTPREEDPLNGALCSCIMHTRRKVRCLIFHNGLLLLLLLSAFLFSLNYIYNGFVRKGKYSNHALKHAIMYAPRDGSVERKETCFYFCLKLLVKMPSIHRRVKMPFQATPEEL